MSGSFQTNTYPLQAPGQPGDFASSNPRATALSSQIYNSAGFRAGPSGLTIGLFAWLDTSTYTLASNSGSGVPTGFVHRDNNALITTYLSAYGTTIPAGFPVGCIFTEGEFFALNAGTTEATPGMKAYANNVTGVVTFAATGNPTTSATSTASTIAAGTASVTASITDNVMTVTAVGSGTLYAGSICSGTGVATGTAIVNQLTGTTGGVGTYTVSIRDQSVASTTVSTTYGLLTIGGTVTGTYAVGDTVAGSGISAGTVITQLGTGTGQAGTYIVNLTQTISSQAINVYSTTETQWYCRSFGLAGDVVKISSRAVG